VSKLFRTKQWLTLAQLTRAWSPELVEGEEDPKQCEQNLMHILLEDIVNGRLDDTGPLRKGQRQRLGLRCITPDNKPRFIRGCQLLDPIRADQAWTLNNVLVMKEAVLDFAQRHELSSPSWWVDSAGTPTEVPNDANAIIVQPNAAAVVSPSLGKQPRIAEYLRDHFPAGVPDPGSRPRHILKADLLKWDPDLKPLDEGTLKRAIDTYNARLNKPEA
jgi:hypothetical protein